MDAIPGGVFVICLGRAATSWSNPPGVPEAMVHLPNELGTLPFGTVRFGPGGLNTLEEVDRVVVAIEEVVNGRV